MKDFFTGKHILQTFAVAGIPAVWEWTGGSCRAVLVLGEDGIDGRHARITGEWDPFTDHDFDHSVAGALTVGLYRHEEDEGAVRIVNATTPRHLLQTVTRLLDSH